MTKYNMNGAAGFMMYDYEGGMWNMTDEDMRDFLTGDICIVAMSSISDVPEEDLIEFIIEWKKNNPR